MCGPLNVSPESRISQKERVRVTVSIGEVKGVQEVKPRTEVFTDPRLRVKGHTLCGMDDDAVSYPRCTKV